MAGFEGVVMHIPVDDTSEDRVANLLRSTNQDVTLVGSSQSWKWQDTRSDCCATGTVSIEKIPRTDETSMSSKLSVVLDDKRMSLLLPTETKPDELDMIIDSGFRGLMRAKNGKHDYMKLETTGTTSDAKDVSSAVRMAVGGVEHLVNPDHAIFCDPTINDVQLDLPFVFQPRVQTQWHPGMCGWHALFNACQLQKMAERIATGSIVPDSGQMMLDEAKQLNDPGEFCTKVAHGLSLLHDENVAHVRKGGTTRWPESGFVSGILDEVHLEFLLDKMFHGTDKVSILSSVDMLLDADLDRMLASGRPKGFILGSVTHWLAAAVARHESSGQVFVLFADSYNKNQMVVLDDDDVDRLAHQVVEEYRVKFTSKLKLTERYKHWPQQLLDELYQNGIPEWWKAKPKNKLYWSHKPAKLRTELMFREISASMNFLRRLSTAVTRVRCWLAEKQMSRRQSSRRCSPLGIPTLQEQFDVDPVAMARFRIQTSHVDGHSVAILDATKKYFPWYIRREIDVPEGSALYQAGNSIENRKEAPLPQVPGDVFDRQRVIVNFDQALVERQVCVVIGTGGIGQNTALVLARMGVQHIHLFDFDTVEASNLTRQCLCSLSDLGKYKVDAARGNISELHMLRSKVTTYNGDVLTSWPTLVQVVKRASVMFNCVDVGLMFDYCVNALSKEFKIPLVSGQSVAWKMMSECYSGQPNNICAFCQEATALSYGLDDRVINGPNGILARFHAFMKSNVDDQSFDATVLSAVSLFQFMKSDRQFRIFGSTASDLVSRAVASSGLQGHVAADLTGTELKCVLQKYHDYCEDLLLPGKISKNQDVAFIPRPIYPETRFFGSWVCPCLGCGNMMVSQWANMLTGPTSRNPPTNIVFNLDEGMTAEEQMGYEMSVLGVAMDVNQRTFVNSPSVESCRVCLAACDLASNEELFYGSKTVHLVPFPGHAFQPPSFVDLPEFRYDDRVALALGRCGSNPFQEKFGDEYALVTTPAVPALDPVARLAPRPLVEDRRLPLALSLAPLLKVDQVVASEFPSALKGIASGIRSAMVQIQHRWFRLKGCGNNQEGFPLKKTGDHGEKSVRGACFEHTAARELYMTSLVANILRDAVAPECANIPIGVYRYPKAPPESMLTEFRLDWPLENIERYCAVFETVGDKRLGDHLLAGLDILFPVLVDPEVFNSASLVELIKLGRGIELENNEELWDTSMVCECGMTVAAGLPGTKSVPLRIPPKLGKEGSGLSGDAKKIRKKLRKIVPTSLHKTWNTACDELETCLKSEKSSDGMMALAWQIGWECGKVCRALADGGVSWGTYPDSDGIHCNAHINNMVVGSHGLGGAAVDTGVAPPAFRSLLQPLDFDMAFTKETFLPSVVEQSNQKSMFPKEWEELVLFEQTMGMRTSLAGSDFTNTGVSNSVESIGVNEESRNLIRVAFRDTVVAAYDEARSKATAANPHPLQQDDVQLIRILVRMGLMITSQVIA